MKLTLGLALLSLFFFRTLPLHSQPQFQRHDIDRNLKSASWVQAIDMDGDHDLDLVTASYTGVHWWENESTNFTQNFVGSFHNTWAVHANDVDGDGDVDVMAAASGADEFAYWERQGGYNFSETSLGAALGPESIHAADFDGDGDLDIVGVAWADDQIIWWKNKGNANFERQLVDPNLNNAHSVHTGDMDNDGVMDVVACGVGGTRWYRNDGQGNFSKKQVADKGGWSVFVADLDNDGDQDFLRTQRDNGDVVLFRNNGTARFDSEVIEPGFGDCWSITAGDIDGDGWPDIAGAGFSANEIRVWLNDGRGDFRPGLALDSVELPRGVAIADLDNDGDGDVVAAIRADRDLAWYEVLGVPQSISLTSPQEGENVFTGGVERISWSFSGNIAAVNLQLSLDDGATWTTLENNVPNTGSYDWVIAETAAEECRVRVSDAADDQPFDESKSFSIQPSTLTLLTPNGGEQWAVGEQQLMTWSSQGNVDSVDLAYSIDFGVSWTALAEDLANTGSFLWRVPEATSDRCLVRVGDASDASPSDSSDAAFSLTGSSFNMLSPNGGENWFEGTTHDIRWSSEGRVNTVTLEYSLDAGETWTAIVAVTENDGHFSWLLPKTPSSECLVRISADDENVGPDDSDDTFSLRPSMFTMESPKGGEQWIAGTEQTISWTTLGSVDSVTIEYSTDNGSNWLTIAEAVSNRSSHTLQVPDVSSDSCLVRLSDSHDLQPSVTSETVFSIEVVSSVGNVPTLPMDYQVSQNYPNPFNPATRIVYALPDAAQVTATVYDILGREIRRLVDETQSAGFHTMNWDGRDEAGLTVSSGVYLLTVAAGAQQQVIKMVLSK